MAAQICACNACIEARMKNAIPPCELNKKMQEIHDTIIPPDRGDFISDWDPNHWTKVKSIRISRRAF